MLVPGSLSDLLLHPRNRTVTPRASLLNLAPSRLAPLTVQIYRFNLQGASETASTRSRGPDTHGTGNTFIGLGIGTADSFPVRLANPLALGNQPSSLMGQNNPSEILRSEAGREDLSLLLFLSFLITRNSSRSCLNHD